VRNSSGADQARFRVLGISGVVVTPDTDLNEFASRFILDGVLPTSEHAGKFCVLQEPIPNGGIGRAVVVGVTPVIVSGNSDNAPKYVNVTSDQTYLTSSESGAQVLYEQPTDGVEGHYCLVRLPAGGGGQGNATVYCATTTGLVYPFTGLPNIDGVATADGMTVLVKNQSAANRAQNGPWIVKATGNWVRSSDTLKAGMLFAVRNGTRNTGAVFVLRAEDPITPGTTALQFVNKNVAEYISARAADTSKSTTMDGLTINAGDRVLVTTGADMGVWECLGSSNWVFIEQVPVVGVQQGTSRGQMTWFLDGTYKPSRAVYS